MSFQRGDVVALAPQAMKPFLRGGACSVEELERLTVVALGQGKDGAPTVKLRTVSHQSVGWVPTTSVLLVRKAP